MLLFLHDHQHGRCDVACKPAMQNAKPRTCIETTSKGHRMIAYEQPLMVFQESFDCSIACLLGFIKDQEPSMTVQSLLFWVSMQGNRPTDLIFAAASIGKSRKAIESSDVRRFVDFEVSQIYFHFSDLNFQMIPNNPKSSRKIRA